ncbi:tRNA-dihydrouridine synthase family protein [Pseudanabaena galeata UHCC 0370]|uniref:tRNA-dihydrouridine synthase n=2 Tax=Pseudanabaena galeata TaxID=1112103 RepID=A0ABU5TP80_9CYAN|nr:tRNA-dihydrouridine synthase family protein [Pseudanabaena galeata]MEA5480084.1 tRNA-dihydrouridine synthase family protein [Pseudanabaena galeata UHCC 0370]
MQETLPPPILSGQPLTALAPMQDVTDLAFMQMLSAYGCPDYYVTEYFRVYANSNIDKKILRSITLNTTGRPVFAQLIGESIPDILRIANQLTKYPIAGIDLNLGCPAPRVYRKNVGGGLLREPETIERIFEAMRSQISGLFTVKMRVGFDSTDNFEKLLNLINQYQIDLLSLHGRTVKELYRGEVHYDLIRQAVQTVNCPVLANGNITSYLKAQQVLQETGAAGVMIGRSAIRNPWIFQQIRDRFAGKNVQVVTLADVHKYIQHLFTITCQDTLREKSHVNSLKKFLNFIGTGIDPEGKFLAGMRLVQSKQELFELCDRHLLTNPEQPFAIEPYENLVARPSCESCE